MANSTRQNLNEKISQVVDRVLRYVFGDEGAGLIYTYLERKYSVRPNEICEKIDLFAKGLEEFLKSGARIIERKILEDVYSSYGSLQKLELMRTGEFNFAHQMRLIMQKN